MSKRLSLKAIDPLKAFEKSLLQARDQFCAENKGSMSSVRIIIKKKKVINREDQSNERG